MYRIRGKIKSAAWTDIPCGAIENLQLYLFLNGTSIPGRPLWFFVLHASERKGPQRAQSCRKHNVVYFVYSSCPSCS
jgi:hypothetical protein